MITDEKRRRVVHTLRKLDNIVENEHMDRTIEHDSTILSMIKDATFGLDGSIFQRLADLIDRGECENVYDENEMGACDNGFECSVCGCRVEDEEHYHVSGTWNFCPQCGRKVVNYAH